MSKSANRLLLDKTIEDELNISRLTAKEREKVIVFMVLLTKKLNAQLLSLPDFENLSHYRKKREIIHFLNDAEKEIQVEFKKYREEFTETLEEVAKYENSSIAKDFESILGAGFFYNAALSSSKLKTLVNETWIEGKTVKEMIESMEANYAIGFKKIIRDSYLEGLTIGETIKRVKGYTGDKGFVYNGIVKKSKKAVEKIVRTAISGIANTVREETLKQNSRLLKGVQWVATLDGKTCLECGALDGAMWDMDGKPLKGGFTYLVPPLHYSCRCTITPVVKSWKDLGEKIDNTQNNMDGQVPGTLTFEDWFESQSKDLQEDVLGKGRYDLYKQGKITFSDLIDQNGRGLTIVELKRKKGIK